MDNEKNGSSKNKKAWLNALLAIIPGAGQVRNKQWYKAIFLWVALFVLILIEVSTSTYGNFDKEKDTYIPVNNIEIKLNYYKYGIQEDTVTQLPIIGTSDWEDESWIDTTPIVEEISNFSTKKKALEYFEVDNLVQLVSENEGISIEEAESRVFASDVNEEGAKYEDKGYYIEQTEVKSNETYFDKEGNIDYDQMSDTSYVTGVNLELRLYSYNMSKTDSDARSDYEVEYYNQVQEKLDNFKKLVDDYNAKVKANNLVLQEKNKVIKEEVDRENELIKQQNEGKPAGEQLPLIKYEDRAIPLQVELKATINYTKASFYYFRDYGGFFVKGVWGLFTLGEIKDGVEYRGAISNVHLKDFFDKKSGVTEIVEPTWTRFDVSQYLMALGLLSVVLIVLVLVLYFWSIVDSYKVRKQHLEGAKPLSVKEFFKKTFDSMFAYIILIPAIILVLCFTLVPMLFSLLIAFTNYSYASNTITAGTIFDWDGFNAFLTIVKDKDVLGFFLDVLLWTVIWAFCTSFTVYAMGFVNALIIESKAVCGVKIPLKNGKCISLFGKKFWRTILILPWAIPGMITLMSAKNLFATDGPVNLILSNANLSQTVANFLKSIGLTEGNSPVIEWLGSKTGENANLAKVVLIVVNLWLGSPYHMMLIIGVLATISPELYEAADIDGATSFQKFRYITLPQVLLSTLPSIIMTFSHNFNNFGAIYFLTGGGPLRADYIGRPGVPGKTDILISWIYKLTFTENEQYYNRGAIYSILIFLGIGIVSVWNMSRTKMMQEEE